MKKSLIILAVLLAPICAWAQDEAKEPQKVAEAPTPTIVKVKGDVNNDGKLDINDVLATVDYILGKEVDYSGHSAGETYFRMAADINGDSDININDVLLMVDTILGKQ